MTKKFTRKSFLLTSFICVAVVAAHAQAGSVTLKDGLGAVVGTYSTIEAAYAATPTTITQPYLIEFNSTYNGSAEALPINMPTRTGASSTNTITIRPETGNTTSSMTVNTTTQVFQLAGTDYVIFDGRAGGIGNTRDFSIINTNTTPTVGVFEMSNGATNNILRYVSIQRAGTTGSCISITNSLSAAGNGCSYNVVENCKTEGAAVGINIRGTAASQSLFDTIRNCTFTDFATPGINPSTNSNQFFIDNNQIYHTTTLSAGSLAPAGILINGSGVGSFTIKNNVIKDMRMPAANNAQIHGINITQSAVGTAYIYNNMISITHDGFGANGISLGSQSNVNTMYIYHNTIYIAGVSTSSNTGTIAQCILRSTMNNNTCFINNNILINARTGGGMSSKLPAFYISDSSQLTMNNNCYSALTTGYLVGTYYELLTDLQSVVNKYDLNSVSNTPVFLSTTDLHLSGASLSDVALLGIPLAEVTTDIDGEIRSITAPKMGADETSVPVPVKLISFNASKLNDKVILKWVTATEINNSHFEIERSADTKQFNTIAIVSGSGNSNNLVNYSTIDEQPVKGINYYRLKQVDFNGSYEYSKIVAIETNSTQPEIISVNSYKNEALFYSTTNSRVSVDICDIQGRKLYSMEEQLTEGVNTVDFSNMNLTHGIYIMTISSPDGLFETQKFIH